MTTKPAAQQLSRMSAGELLSGQPPEWSVPHAMATIRDRVKGQGTHIAVLDDDPTGTQSVHGVPVLTTWESADLRAALRHPPNAFFFLTNSRGRSRPEAAAISQTIATRLADLADELGIDVEAISRSDSTLRGHFPTEIDALQQGFGERGRRYDGVIICPCFLEAGRVTVNDVQWVREGDQFVPAAGTEFAADATFGYQSSNLRAWVQEKTEGRIPFEEVRSISLADIRNGGPRRVAERLPDSDVVLYTSRDLVRTDDPDESLAARACCPASSSRPRAPSRSSSRTWDWSPRRPRDEDSRRRWRQPRTNSSSSAPLRATPAMTTRASCGCSSSGRTSPMRDVPHGTE